MYEHVKERKREREGGRKKLEKQTEKACVRIRAHVRICEYVGVCSCVRACMCMCQCVCVCVCACVVCGCFSAYMSLKVEG